MTFAWKAVGYALGILASVGMYNVPHAIFYRAPHLLFPRFITEPYHD